MAEQLKLKGRRFKIMTYLDGVYTQVGDGSAEDDVNGVAGIGFNLYKEMPANQVMWVIENTDLEVY